MKRRVIFFEDDPEAYQRISRELTSRFASSVQPERFDPTSSVARRKDSERASDALANVRKSLLKPVEAILAVLDYDLTKYHPVVAGASIREICTSLGMPVCVYTFQQGPEDRVAFLPGWREREVAIDIEDEVPRIAEFITGYAEGFGELRQRFRASGKVSPSIAFKEILGAPPEAGPRLEQYLWSGALPIGVLLA